MTLYAKWSVEVLAEENDNFGDDQDTEDESEKIDNGKAPSLLDADKVVIDKADDSAANTNNGMQLWVIILVAAGAAIALAAIVFVVIVLVRRKSKKA